MMSIGGPDLVAGICWSLLLDLWRSTPSVSAASSGSDVENVGWRKAGFILRGPGAKRAHGAATCFRVDTNQGVGFDGLSARNFGLKAFGGQHQVCRLLHKRQLVGNGQRAATQRSCSNASTIARNRRAVTICGGRRAEARCRRQCGAGVEVSTEAGNDIAGVPVEAGGKLPAYRPVGYLRSTSVGAHESCGDMTACIKPASSRRLSQGRPATNCRSGAKLSFLCLFGNSGRVCASFSDLGDGSAPSNPRGMGQEKPAR